MADSWAAAAQPSRGTYAGAANARDLFDALGVGHGGDVDAIRSEILATREQRKKILNVIRISSLDGQGQVTKKEEEDKIKALKKKRKQELKALGLKWVLDEKFEDKVDSIGFSNWNVELQVRALVKQRFE